MNGGTIPHHRQSAYDRGLEDGRMERAHWIPMGISIGVPIGAFIVWIVQWIKS